MWNKTPSQIGFSDDYNDVDGGVQQTEAASDSDLSRSSSADNMPMSDEVADHHNPAEMDISRDVVKSNMYKERGNRFFNNGEYEEAAASYTVAIEADVSNPILYSNRSMALLKKAEVLRSKLAKGQPLPNSVVEIYLAADQDCSQALRLDKDFVKAYFRRGQARKALGLLSEALFDFEAVLRLDPHNTLAERESASLKSQLLSLEKSKKPIFTEFKCIPVVPYERKSSWTGYLKRICVDEVNKNYESESDGTKFCLQSAEPMDTDTTIAVPSVPASSYEFYADWRHLQKSSRARTEYLLAISPDEIRRLFKVSLEIDVFCDIISLLYSAVLTDSVSKQQVVEVLEALTGIGRFDALKLFLDGNDLQKVKEMLIDSEDILRLWTKA